MGQSTRSRPPRARSKNRENGATRATYSSATARPRSERLCTSWGIVVSPIVADVIPLIVTAMK